jgi:hypothetical protein
MYRLFYSICILVLFSCCSCNNDKNGKKSSITIFLYHAQGSKIYLEKWPQKNAIRLVLDSAVIEKNIDTIKLKMPHAEESVYVIRTKGNLDYSFEFVNDVDEVQVKADVLFKDKLTFYNSPANIAYSEFIAYRLNEAKTIKTITDSLLTIKLKGNKTDAQRAGNQIDSLQRAVNLKWMEYADAMKSPANYLRIFPSLEFHDDTTLLISKVKLAKQRFPTHSEIDALYSRMNDYMNVFRKELYINDKFPDLTLPDKNAKPVSINEYYDKYVLVEFWSSVYPGNNKIDLSLKETAANAAGKNFTIVSIAIEPGTADWKKSPKTIYADWPQLIDSLAWSGSVVKATGIDSIPFNFLLKPGGIIIDKAINTDSLTNIVLRKIK